MNTLLLQSGFTYDPYCGSYFREDSKGNVHTYMEVENNQWNYEKYDVNDQLIVSQLLHSNEQLQFND